MKLCELKNLVSSGKLDASFASCGVGDNDILSYRERVMKAADSFASLYDKAGERDVALLSVGGRSEISGNHTDHNHGKVIAGAISLDVIAIAAKTDDGVIRVKSEGFPEDVVPGSAADAPDEAAYFKSSAIIAGMEHAFSEHGYEVGGFDAYTTSAVLKGSGMSSSAAFEVMIGNILNSLYNGGSVPNTEIAKMAQYAENVYFGKPCGLMDQMACAVGGLITIDFADPAKPVIEKLDFDLTSAGYALCIVDTGGNHADLNEDYASVPAEMKSVAALLGKTYLRETTAGEIIAHAAEIRKSCGDRALLRALHFHGENARVDRQVGALKAGNVAAFLEGVRQSGNSSFRFLQNVYTTKNVAEQGLSVALCLTEQFLSGVTEPSACRVHGGGFAGTVQVFLPAKNADEYKKYIESVFGGGSCYILLIRPAGAVRLA